MGAIDPNIGPITQPSVTTTPTTTPTTTTPPGTPITQQDQISNAAQELNLTLITPGQRIQIPAPSDDSLLSFLTTVGDSLKDLRQLLHEVEVFDQLLSRSVIAANIGTAVGVNEFHGEVVGFAQLYEELSGIMNVLIDAQNVINQSMNDKITKPKGPPPGNAPGGDIVQVNDMNNSIDAFNAGTITLAQFQSDSSTYNQYVDDRNPEIEAYNQAVQAYNSALGDQQEALALLNELGANIGAPQVANGEPLEEIPLMEKVTGLVPPVSSLDPRQPLDKLTLTKLPVLTEYDILEAIFVPVYDSVFPNLTSLRDRIELTEAYINFATFLLPGKNIAFPNAIFDSIPQVFLTNSASAGIVSAINTLGALSSASLESALSLAMFTRTADRLRIPISAQLFDGVAALNLQLLSRLGNTSALPAARLLGDGLSAGGAGSLPIRVALASAFVGRIRAMVSDNSMGRAVSRLLRRELKGQGLSFGQMAGLSRAITAGISLSQLGIASLQLAKTLGLPGLMGQLMANIPGVLPNALAAAAVTSLGLNNVLGSAFSRTLLKFALADKISQFRGVSPTLAQSLASTVVNNVASFPFQSETQLRNTLAREFRDLGLNRLQSRILANAATNLIQDEARLPFLDSAYSRAALNPMALTAQLATTLAVNGYDVPSGTLVLNNAIQKTLDRDFDSVRDFRNGLKRELKRQGFGGRASRTLANQAAEFLERGSIGVTFGNLSLPRAAAEQSIIGDLAGQGIYGRDAERIAERALDRTERRGPYASPAEFQNRLRKEIGRAGDRYGFDIHGERGIAAGAVANAQFAGIVSNPLFSPGITGILSPGLLAEGIAAQVIAELTPSVGLSIAQRLANETALAMIGFSGRERDEVDIKNPHSVLNLIQDQLEALREIDDDFASRQLEDIFREFVNPNMDLLLVAERILRPAEQELGIIGGPNPNKQDIQFLGGV